MHVARSVGKVLVNAVRDVMEPRVSVFVVQIAANTQMTVHAVRVAANHTQRIVSVLTDGSLILHLLGVSYDYSRHDTVVGSHG